MQELESLYRLLAFEFFHNYLATLLKAVIGPSLDKS